MAFLLTGIFSTRYQFLQIRALPLETAMRNQFFTSEIMKLWNSLSKRVAGFQLQSISKTEVNRFVFNIWGIERMWVSAGKWH